MSVRALVIPPLAAWLTSEGRERTSRRLHRLARRGRRRRPTVEYFHQVDDPYSALAAVALPAFVARYDIDLRFVVVGPPSPEAAPEPRLLAAYARTDASRLAEKLGIGFDFSRPPGPEKVAAAAAHLAGTDDPVGEAAELSRALWSGATIGRAAPGSAGTAEDQQRLGEARRARLGHYQAATFYFEGEWYTGLDRLHYLESRLADAGLCRDDAGPAYPPPVAKVADSHTAAGRAFSAFLSLRSPYSMLAAEQLFEIERRTNSQCDLHFVLPMVMRGLAVPRNKRMYILLDAAREARRLGVPFGRVADPVGRPTERGLAAIEAARASGRERALACSFYRAVWAEGIDAGSDRGLRRIVERAGVSWAAVCAAIEAREWQGRVEASQRTLRTHGLWGVPCFVVGEQRIWGRDRLWALEEALGLPDAPS